MDDDLRKTERHLAEDFLEHYAACERKLYVYIVALTGNSIESHDILQDTALVLWQKFDQFRRDEDFAAWARGIARYRVLRYRQMRAGEARALEPSALDAVAARLDQVDDRRHQRYIEVLPDCVEKLSDGDRELLQVRYASDVTVRSLARKLNRSENAISQSLVRIRRLVRECVESTIRGQVNEEEPLG